MHACKYAFTSKNYKYAYVLVRIHKSKDPKVKIINTHLCKYAFTSKNYKYAYV